MLHVWNEWRVVLRARHLIWVLTKREVAARHAGTAGGLLWLYIQPLFTVAAYYLIFDVVFSMRHQDSVGKTTGMGLFLIVGALPWMAFCDNISRGMASLIESGGILQKNPMPPVYFVARSVLSSFIIFGPLLLLMISLYAALRGVSFSLLALVPVIFYQVLLASLLGYALAILAAALRDTLQMIGFMLSVGIYLTPALFPITLFPSAWRWVLWLNPMTSVVTAYQTVLLEGGWPAWDAWLVSIAWIIAIALVLNVLIKRSKDQLVDWL